MRTKTHKRSIIDTFGQLVEISSHDLGPVEEILFVELLIDGVCAIIAPPHRKQDDIFYTIYLGKCKSDIDTTAFTSQVGSFPVNSLLLLFLQLEMTDRLHFQATAAQTLQSH